MGPDFRPILSHKMRVLLGISISVIFHLLLVLFVQHLPTYLPKKSVIEVVIVNPPSQNKTSRQIVTSAQLPDNFKESKEEDQKALLSAFKQRVEKQMQAAHNGATKNRSNLQKDNNVILERQKQNSLQVKVDPRKPGSLDVFASSKNHRTVTEAQNQSPDKKSEKHIPELEKGLSTIGDALPTDIEVGSFTALNTDQSLFYTFYARINEMIRLRWEMAVRSSIAQTPPDRFSYNPTGVWVTHLDISLDKQGVIQQVLLMKPSGFRDFDQAAIFAFKDSKAFFNPPKEMISPDDGMIHLKYSFQVRYEPKIVSHSR